MNKMGLALLIVLSTSLSPAAQAQDKCSKCSCRSYPVPTACEKCCKINLLTSAGNVVQELMETPDRGIPTEIAKIASCVVVVPAVKKGAFVFGGGNAEGVATCRTSHGWSAPVFLSLEGSSFGFQMGGQTGDVLLLSTDQRGIQAISNGRFKLGGDVSATAGPVGRNAQADTDFFQHAEFLTYSRSRGLFAGIDLDGTSITQNKQDTDQYYGKPVSFETLLKGQVPPPESAQHFLKTVGDLLGSRRN